MAIQNAINRTILTGTRVQLGSDATGDIYYRNSSGVLTRLAIGTDGQQLVASGGLPTWTTGGGGYSDEQAQDAVGTILTDSSEIDFTYNDATPSITASIVANSLTFSKLQAIATGSILGRTTAGTAEIEVLTPSQARTVMGLGTAATANTGTSSGNVPVLDVSGKLSTSVLPPLSITSIQVVSNQAARLALSNVQEGDAVKQTDNGITYLLTSGDPSINGSWVPIGDTAIDAGDVATGIFDAARLGANTANEFAVLFGDQTWQDPATTRLRLGLQPASTFTWNAVSGTTQTMVENNGYRTTNASLTTLTLPAGCDNDSIIRIVGYGAGGWRIAQNTGQTIHFLGLDTTTGSGGRLDSTTRYDCITLQAVASGTEWVVTSVIGNIDVI